jgi:hypothetical protein
MKELKKISRSREHMQIRRKKEPVRCVMSSSDLLDFSAIQNAALKRQGVLKTDKQFQSQ